MKDKTYNYLAGLYGNNKNRHLLFWFTTVVSLIGLFGMLLFNRVVFQVLLFGILFILFVVNRLCMLSYDIEKEERDSRGILE